MNKLVYIFILFALSAASHSEPYVYTNGSYKFEASNNEECYGLGTSSPMLSVCLNHFKNLSLNKLNSSYDKLLSNLIRDKNELVKAQEKWEEFAKLQCQFEARASKASSKPYNAYTEMFNICIDKLREERTAYLKKIDTGCAACVQ